MAGTYYRPGEGGVSTAFPRVGDIPIKYVKKKKRVSHGGGSNKQSTIATPTPSASELYGTSKQKEAQLRAYSSGGRAAFEIEKKKAQVTTVKTISPTKTIEPQLTPEGGRKIKPNETVDEGWYKNFEKNTSQKLYELTGFSQKQHDIQRQNVLDSEAWLKNRVSSSTQTVMDWGIPSFVAKSLGGIANLGIKTGTLISGGVGTLGKATMDKPITTGITSTAVGVGIGAGLGFVIPTVANAASKVPVVGGAISKTIPIVTTGIGALYAGKVATDVYKARTSFEQGGILTMEAKNLASLTAGYKVGSKSYTKAYDWWRTRGMKEIPIEEIVLPEVLSGKDTFVESKHYGYKGGSISKKQKFDLGIFNKKGAMYHATGEKFWKNDLRITTPGTSEFEGLYGAPSPSIYFLRGGGESPKMKLFGNGKVTSPAIAKIKTEFDVTKVGRTGKGGKSATWEFLGELKEGKAYVTGIKPEIEAVIPVSTSSTFAKVGSEGYIKFNGRKIPIDVFVGKSSSGGGINTLGGVSKVSGSKLSSSYKLDFGSSVILPSGTLAISFLNKYKNGSSKKSTKNGYIKSFIQNSNSLNFVPNNNYLPAFKKITPYNPASSLKENFYNKINKYIPTISETLSYKETNNRRGQRQFIYLPAIGKSKTKQIRKTREIWALGSSYSAWVFDIRAPSIGKPTFGKFWSGMETKPLTMKGRARAKIKMSKIMPIKKLSKKVVKKKTNLPFLKFKF